MILVTVGTHTLGFERLVKAADDFAAVFNEEIIIQYGCSSYRPIHAKSFAFTGSTEMENLIQKARIVICHAASGTILLSLKNFKRIIAVPRRKNYEESFNDHQLELANVLQQKEWIIVLDEPSAKTITAAIQDVENINPITNPRCDICESIDWQLQRWGKTDSSRKGS